MLSSTCICLLCLLCCTCLSIRTIITFGDYLVNLLFYLDDKKIDIMYDLVSGRNTRLDLASIIRITFMCIIQLGITMQSAAIDIDQPAKSHKLL